MAHDNTILTKRQETVKPPINIDSILGAWLKGGE